MSAPVRATFQSRTSPMRPLNRKPESEVSPTAPMSKGVAPSLGLRPTNP